MEPEIQPTVPEALAPETAPTPALTLGIIADDSEPRAFGWLIWAFIGNQGLRAGWSVASFVILFSLFASAAGYAFVHLHLIAKKEEFTASSAFFGELVAFLALVAAASLVALIERRRSLLAFNLTGPRSPLHFLSGLAAGFLALSALVGALAWGGWLHFGPIALTGADIFKFAALWGCAFLLVGCVEEGVFRCYLQFTLTRGINFWWALGIVALICGDLLLTKKGNGLWGVYAVAAGSWQGKPSGAEWIMNKVEIRSIRKANLLHGKMYHIANGGVEDAIMGSSNFTVSGLGQAENTSNIELNLIVDSSRDRVDLKNWFDSLWGNDELVEDVKTDVLEYLAQLYQDNAPEFIYYKTLFHVFENFLADQEKGGLLDQNIKIVDTDVWKALFEFQSDGVKGAINKILKHNGCILADSVGLGKTYTALAVIRYFELRNERVLVLCPKKLRDNWTVYRLNDQLNPFGADRFRYDVLSHTDLSREVGYSGDINLATLNWGN